MKDLKNQMENIEVTQERIVRTIVSWDNNESGRDPNEKYERIDTGGFVYYVNCYNIMSRVYKGEFFDLLESIYVKLKEI